MQATSRRRAHPVRVSRVGVPVGQGAGGASASQTPPRAPAVTALSPALHGVV